MLAQKRRPAGWPGGCFGHLAASSPQSPLCLASCLVSRWLELFLGLRMYARNNLARDRQKTARFVVIYSVLSRAERFAPGFPARVLGLEAPIYLPENRVCFDPGTTVCAIVSDDMPFEFRAGHGDSVKTPRVTACRKTNPFPRRTPR